jgi:hypothetical protein
MGGLHTCAYTFVTSKDIFYLVTKNPKFHRPSVYETLYATVECIKYGWLLPTQGAYYCRFLTVSPRVLSLAWVSVQVYCTNDNQECILDIVNVERTRHNRKYKLPVVFVQIQSSTLLFVDFEFHLCGIRYRPWWNLTVKFVSVQHAILILNSNYWQQVYNSFEGVFLKKFGSECIPLSLCFEMC